MPDQHHPFRKRPSPVGGRWDLFRARAARACQEVRVGGVLRAAAASAVCLLAARAFLVSLDQGDDEDYGVNPKSLELDYQVIEDVNREIFGKREEEGAGDDGQDRTAYKSVAAARLGLLRKRRSARRRAAEESGLGEGDSTREGEQEEGQEEEHEDDGDGEDDYDDDDDDEEEEEEEEEDGEDEPVETEDAKVRCRDPGTKLLAVKDCGRLGNFLSQYATLMGMARLTGATPVVTDKKKRWLGYFLEKVSAPAVSKRCLGRFKTMHAGKVYRTAADAAAKGGDPFPWGKVRLEGCVQELKPFHERWGEIRGEFAIKAKLLDLVRGYFDHVRAAEGEADLNLVGVHMRRNDYKEHLAWRYDTHLLRHTWFKLAMEEMRLQLAPEGRRVVFLLASDDAKYANNKFSDMKDVYRLNAYPGVEDKTRAKFDLAVLASCNHSIVDYGTYSFWGAYLAGGKTILADKYLPNNQVAPLVKKTVLQNHLEGWIPFPRSDEDRRNSPWLLSSKNYTARETQ